MATRHNFITKELYGEAISYARNDIFTIQLNLKQDYHVEIDYKNFLYNVTSNLYVKADYNIDQDLDGIGVRNIYMCIGDDYAYLGPDDDSFNLIVMTKGDTFIKLNDVILTNDPWNYVKIMTFKKTYNFNFNTTFGLKLQNGPRRDEKNYLHNEYTIIYLTLPPLTDIFYKLNNQYKLVVPWIKIANKWRRCKQFVKVNGLWKQCNNNWSYQP